MVKGKGMGTFYGKCLKWGVGHNKLKLTINFWKKTES